MIGGRDGARSATGRERLAAVAGIALLSLTIGLVTVGAVLLLFGGGFGRIVWGLPGVPGLWALGFSVAGYPITHRHPSQNVDDIGAKFGKPSSFSVLMSTTGVPKYRIAGSATT